MGKMNGSKEHPIFTAIRGGDEAEAARILREDHLALEARSRDGLSPMHAAAKAGKAKILKGLIDAGGDPEQPGAKERCPHCVPLMLAARSGEALCARILMEAGASPTKGDEYAGDLSIPWVWGVFHEAGSDKIARRRASVLREMERFGWSKDSRGCRGMSALHWAAIDRSGSRMLRELLEMGLDPKALDQRGKTPAMLAAEEGQAHALEELILRGEDPGGRDDKGNTALHLASMSGYLGCVETLLQAGWDPCALNRDGLTPGEAARRMGIEDVIPVLRSEIERRKLASIACEGSCAKKSPAVL